jgi:hypothetical protein
MTRTFPRLVHFMLPALVVLGEPGWASAQAQETVQGEGTSAALASRLEWELRRFEGMQQQIRALKERERPGLGEVLRLQALLREAWEQARVLEGLQREMEGAARLRSEPVPWVPMPWDQIRARLTETPEELRALAEELADHAARAEAQRARLGSALVEAERRERMVQRVRALGMEEWLFEDSGVRRAGAPARASGGVPRSDAPVAQGGAAGGGRDDEAGRPVSGAGDSAADGLGAGEGLAPPAAPEAMPGPGTSGDFGGDRGPAPGMPPVTGQVGEAAFVPAPDPRGGPGVDPALLLLVPESGAGGRRGSRSVSQLREEQRALEAALEGLRRERQWLLERASELERPTD